jgi:hypothetical protein
MIVPVAFGPMASTQVACCNTATTYLTVEKQREEEGAGVPLSRAHPQSLEDIPLGPTLNVSTTF